MKDYYTLKEVLLGLRNEQLRLANMLNELDKKMTVYGNKRYEDSGFTFSENGNLLYFLKEQNTFLKNALYAITLRFKDIIDGDCYLESIRTLGDGNYKVGGIGGIKSNVKETEQENFNKLINLILEDDFRKGAIFKRVDNKGTNYSNSLVISPGNTKYTNSTFKRVDAISYHAKKDYLRINNVYGSLRNYKDTITELLEMKFPRKDFSLYLQNVIDSNELVKKDILIPDFNINSRSCEFYLEEFNNSFVLSKKYNIDKK